MEKIGLIAKLGDNLNQGWDAYLLVNESREVKKRNEILGDTLATLKTITSTKDIKLALGVEEMMLRQELTTYANSPEEANSVTKALEQVQEARQSFKVVEDHKAYKTAANTYPNARKEAGLPVDAFRTFLKSHSTRLTNRMTSNISVPEKNIIRQRKENLAMMRDVYIGMQREALGLVPAKEKGIER